MSCKCNQNGTTVLLSKSLVITGTPVTTQQQYAVSLLHYLNCNRQICITSSYPLTGALTAQVVGDPVAIGNNTYNVNIQLTGTVTYMPYVRNCNNCCAPSAKHDDVFITVSADVYSATGTPEVTLGSTSITPVVTAANVNDCCSLTNAVSLDLTLVVNSVAPTA